MPTPSKSIMVSQMMHTTVFALSFLRLNLILSRTRKSGSNFSLVFSQSNTIVVPPLVFAILAFTKPYLPAPTAKPTDTKLMGRHHKHISNISPLSHGCVPCFQTLPMRKKCNTDQSTNMTPPKSRTFLMVLIIAHSLRLM